jgi:hypothetical protein
LDTYLLLTKTGDQYGNWNDLRPLRINNATGNVYLSSLAIDGDVAISGKHALRGNDSWLRLNQDGAFTSGVHTPHLLAPNSLNVGGVAGWADPGGGNATIAGTLRVAGNTGIGPTDPGNYRLLISGGNTRLAAPGAEQSLFGIDKLVGLNDLRFYTDDTGTSEVMHLDANGLTVNGNLSWSGDQVGNGYVTLGNLRICWGTVGANVPLYENHVPVGFPAQFAGNPAVMVTVNDPGYGTYDLKGGVGAYNVSSSSFEIIFKALERKDPRNLTFYWIAIGQHA